MASIDPIQKNAEDLRSLQSRLDSLQEKIHLSQVRDAVEDVQTKTGNLLSRIASLRSRGYAFEKDLESRAKNLVTAWQGIFPNLQAQINLQSSTLTNSLRPLEMQLPQITALAGNPAAAGGLISNMKAALDQLENKVSAAENTINGMYDHAGNQVSAIDRRLDEIEYLVKELGEASFRLLPTEAGIAAVKSIWCKAGREQKDDPEGILFLTDQRLLFEQKEEVVTKKVLFVATEKQKVQKLLFEAPVALVEKVDTGKQGLFKNEDLIKIHLASGAPVDTADFHIWQDSEAWQTLINRAVTKDYDNDRAAALDQSAVDKVKAAPSQCPACGGNITTVVLRGMDSIKCEYCGYVIRL